MRKRIVGPGAEVRYRREVTALRLAAKADPPLVPVILDEDPDDQTVVLEFLEVRPGLPDWPSYATALARLHAVGDPHSELPPAQPLNRTDVDAFVRLCAGVHVDVPAEAQAELDALVDRIAGGPRTALLHGDPCFGNVLLTDGGVRFVDFEQAARGDAAVELSYLRIGFPTCGLTPQVPDADVAEAEQAYRDAWHAAAGIGEPGSLVDHCTAWLLRGDALVQRIQRGSDDQFARVLAVDWDWGGTTARQRLARRLGVVAGLAATDLPATAAVASAVRAALPEAQPA